MALPTVSLVRRLDQAPEPSILIIHPPSNPLNIPTRRRRTQSANLQDALNCRINLSSFTPSNTAPAHPTATTHSASGSASRGADAAASSSFPPPPSSSSAANAPLATSSSLIENLVNTGQNPALRKVLFQLGSAQNSDLSAVTNSLSSSAPASSTPLSELAAAGADPSRADPSLQASEGSASTATHGSSLPPTSSNSAASDSLSQPTPQRQPWQRPPSFEGGTSFRQHLERSQVQLQQPPTMSAPTSQPQPQAGMAPQSQNQGGPLDSVTLGQLRNLIVTDKPKSRQYDFPIDADADNMQNEIDEFYSYVEVPQTAENRTAWEEWCTMPTHLRHAGYSSTGSELGTAEPSSSLGLGLDLNHAGVAPHSAEAQSAGMPRRASLVEPALGEWTTLGSSTRRRILQSLLSTLEVRDPEARFRASRALLYLLQGAFADTAGPEHQLHWLLENARMVRSLGGLGEIYSAIKLASWKHDYLSSLPDHIPSHEPAHSGQQGPANAPLLTPEAKLEYLDEINLELALHFAQLYSLLESSRGEEEWGDELMSLDPPLPIFLFGLVASLREKSAKGYPVKKLLLLLWKSLLSCFGGVKDVERCKLLAREIEGLGPIDKSTKRNVLKSDPLHFQDFQHEISVKYPTFEPPKRQDHDLPLDKLASAIHPIPPRKPFSNHLDGSDRYSGGPQQGPNGMLPGTPAPSPPPSPKPNKAKYQTDQTRPFIFPYSRQVHGQGRLVPRSIDEASKLYTEHMHVSLELWQTWRVREQCIQEESGVGSAADGTRIGLGVKSAASKAYVRTDAASSSQGSRSPVSSEAFPPRGVSERTFKVKGEATYEHLVEIEEDIEAELRDVEGDHMLAALDNPRHTELIDQLAQKRADVRRLQRVDQLYRAVLPQLQSSVIVLLKLLLATVTSINTNSAHAAAIAEGAPIDEAPPPTLEDVDVARHREILTKAVSAILLLCLKWFKASHVMKFNYLSQVLVDSNVLLLILKIFGLQEIAHGVKTKNEADNFRFFNYCYLNGGREARGPRAEDSLMSRHNIIGPVAINPGTTSPPPGKATLMPDGTEVEMVSDYSWRNFFSSINFTRILQKLTKRKVHRILLLVQYKSSAILKRSLKVPHPGLELYVLKVIKSQIPFCGRKWRQSNMRVITSIYLNCRPDLRDEWLSGSDVEADVEDSLPQEQALRSLVKFYNHTRFGPPPGAAIGHGEGHGHRRSISTSAERHQQEMQNGQQQGHAQPHMQSQFHAQQPQHQQGGQQHGAQSDGGPHSQEAQQAQRGGMSNGDGANEHGAPPATLSPTRTANGPSFFESDVLPPLRRSHQASAPGGYIPDDVVEGYLDTYEDVLGEVFGENVFYPSDGGGEGGAAEDDGSGGEAGASGSGWSSGKWGLTQQGSSTAWARLGEILGETGITDADTASLDSAHSGAGSVAGSLTDDEGERDENRNDWEHMSPKEMRFLSSGVLSPPSPSPIPLHGGKQPSPLQSPRMSAAELGTSALDTSPGSPVRPFTISGVSSGGGSGSRPGSRRNSRSNSDSSPLRPVLTDWADDEQLDQIDRLAQAEARGEDEQDLDTAQPLPLHSRKAGGIDEVEHIFGT
ncbi:related to FAR11 - protein involved in recovery from cell cycle arrest in response to pheromone [Moesziomyces antarcticus]|uniref:Related to FAR11 - protein involved in recovery from cell cycle arrest in response to pheromone n=1 Tax=Pseudozyma antarctica TaxID=84753 RepID=A0A5C3FLE2_PSEA2|nr:related to FAR11 - protein involved in recovery from cell cycle arrest in response to pheromone [Moesziomyces antarcticus]